MNTIISTASSDTVYVTYAAHKDGKPYNEAIGEILLKGGSHVADPRTLFVPNGVATEVTDKQLEELQNNKLFMEHVKMGVFRIIEHKRKTAVDAEHEAKTMAGPDGSAQRTAKDVEKSGHKVKNGKVVVKDESEEA